jgi:hypothetical protein
LSLGHSVTDHVALGPYGHGLEQIFSHLALQLTQSISKYYFLGCFQIILGKVVRFPATLDDDLRKKLIECSKGTGIPTAEGHTMCTNDFYEGIVLYYSTTQFTV